MKATIENPVYSVYVVDGTTKYNLTPALISLSFSSQEEQLAECFTIEVANVRVGNGDYLNLILRERQRVFVYANTGDGKQEVFRGYIWIRTYDKTVNSQYVTLKCYTNLIYLQESEDSLFFSKGKSTKEIMSSICKRWGIALSYSYSSITHGKLALRGTLGDLITDDILDKVKEKTGNDYVILSVKDQMQVKKIGQNTTVYKVLVKKNAVKYRSERAMDGMVTQVVILGKQNKNDKYPVKATVKGNTAKYGTLQQLIDLGEDSLSAAKKEAQNILKEKGQPSILFEVTAPDVPWIKRGDLVNVFDKNLVCTSIDRSIDSKSKTMTLTCKALSS